MKPRAPIVVLALFLAACGAPPESRVALSEPGAAAYDARLPGKWVWAEKEGAHYLHIAPRADSALLDVLSVGVGYQEGDPVRWLRAVAHASAIDGETYYNVKRVAGLDYTADGEQPGYILLRIEFTGYSFVLDRLSETHNSPLAYFQPQFIVDQVVSACRYDGGAPHLSIERAEQALANLCPKISKNKKKLKSASTRGKQARADNVVELAAA